MIDYYSNSYKGERLSLRSSWAAAKKSSSRGAVLAAEDLVLKICQKLPAASDENYESKFLELEASAEVEQLKELAKQLPERIRLSDTADSLTTLVWAIRVGGNFVARQLS